MRRLRCRRGTVRVTRREYPGRKNISLWPRWSIQRGPPQKALPRTTPFTSSVRLQGTVVDKKDLQFKKRKFCQLYMRYTRKIMAVTPFQCPDIEWMCGGGDSTERGWFQRRPLEGRPSWCNWQRTVEELLKQAEEKYSLKQRAIEEVGP